MKRPTLKRRRDFERAYQHGRKVWNDALVAFVLPTPAEERSETFRYGLTATKKVGNAVQRNRMKRLLRESFRLSADRIRGGLDIVIVVRPPLLEMSCQEARDALLRALDRAKALR